MAAKKQLKKTVAQKVNKDAKPSEAEPRVVSDEVYRCPRCGHKYPKQDGNFNVSKSPLFKGNNGYVVYCKKCVAEMFDENVAFFDKDEDAAMERVCQIIDLCVNETAWAAARKISANRNRMSGYFSKLNIRQSSEDSTYSDTLVRRFEAEAEMPNEASDTDDTSVNLDVIRRFGLGFSDSDYDTLQGEYDSWVERCGAPVDKRQDELYVSMWDLMKIIVKDMLEKDSAIIIGMDYSISLKHAIKPRAFLIKERNKLDSVAWAIEYENQMIAENAHAYFTYEMLNKNRCLKRPFYPRKNEDVLTRAKNPFAIPRQQGEIRIVACDIATEGGDSNDNSIFCCIRALPESMEYKTSDVNGDHVEVKQGYRRQVLYMEPQTEFETTKQAIRIKQLFTDFDADYCVLDTRNAGIAICDALAKVLYDVERNVEYEPWTCMNDDNLKSRIVIAGQKEVVFSIKAQLETNSRIAVCMKNTLNSKMIELMVPNQEGVEELQRFVPDYATADVETQLFYERPFLETVALINEMISLEYTVQNQTGLIKIEEKSGARKDRYTSVSYGNYFIELLEQDLFSDSSEYEYVTLFN